LGPLFGDPRVGDIVVVTRVPLDRVGWRHSVAVAIKQHPGEQAGLASRWAGVAPGGIAGELRRNRIPERRINDRDVVAGMGLSLVDDLAAIDAVLQDQVERAARKRLAADDPTCGAGPRFAVDATGVELFLQ